MAARVPYLEREQVPAEVQAVYDIAQKGTGRVLNIFKLMAHHARSLPPFLQWYPTLQKGALDIKLRQLAYVKASQLNHCNYCETHNSALGQKVGVPREQFQALAEYETSPTFTDLERLVIRYAEVMTTKVQVDAALVEELRSHLSPEALVQLTLSIAAANFTNRFNEALGTELESSPASH